MGASSHGEPKTLAIIPDAVNDTAPHLWVIVDAAVDFQIIRKLAWQPLEEATDSSLGTQTLQLWAALRRLPKHVVLHLVRQEYHRYSLSNGHWLVVGDDPVELEWHRSPEHRFLDLWLPH